MAYCGKADIIAIYGDKHLVRLVAVDVDRDAAVAGACDFASAMIDGYIAKRYATPLAVVPALVRAYAIDIACWKLAATHDRLTEEAEKRCKAALDFFKDVSSGKAVIAELETASSAPGGEESAASSDGAAFSSNERRFGGQGGLP